MPPPRHIRYLRPCYPPRDAPQVRGASRIPSSGPVARPNEQSAQSLLEELFPETSPSYVQPCHLPNGTAKTYPKLELPRSEKFVHGRKTYERPRTLREQMIESMRSHGEKITVLQLLHCSTELTEADFRRIIPRGKHIESWVRDGGDLYHIIPGRDPISLERQPFYYLLFKTPEAALAYQNNASRLHKLSALHQNSSLFSAIPPPKGFLEEGEDLQAATSSYLLRPTNLKSNLMLVKQPYSPSFAALVESGGYKPLVPDVDEHGRKLWKVLLHVEGWEPLPEDLFHIFNRHAYSIGMVWPFHRGAEGIRKLRDLVEIPKKLPSPSTGGRAEASGLDLILATAESGSEDSGEPSISQIVMDKLYNRWIIEFEEEQAARRFARIWHRRVLPEAKISWRVMEAERVCNTEFLW